MATRNPPAELQAPEVRRPFAIIFVIGPPGAGKATLCRYLASRYNLVQCSIHTLLLDWATAHFEDPLAKAIASNQSSMSSGPELLPFIRSAIRNAMGDCGKGPHRGIIIDGFPRSEEQMWMLSPWPFEEEMPLHGSKPDLVLKLNVDKEKAKQRYLSRKTDHNDNEEQFEKRFEQYDKEGAKVEKAYREKGIFVRLDGNTDKVIMCEDAQLRLERSELWSMAVVDQRRRALSWFKRWTWA